jgi:transcription termination factor Rho
MTAEQQLERSVLERKEREELRAIAQAMALETNSRSKKADIIDQILHAAGVDGSAPASNGDSAARARGRRSAPATDAGEDGSSADTQTVVAVEDAPPSGDGGGDTASNGSATDRVEAPSTPADRSHGGPQRGQSRPGAGNEPGNRRNRRRRGRDRGAGGERELQGGGQEAQYSGELLPVKGLLDLRDEGYGFLRAEGYLPSPRDVYVSISQARRFALRKGDYVEGASRPAASNEKFPALIRIDSVCGLDAEQARGRPRFEDLTPLFPDEKLKLEMPGAAEVTTRIIDLLAPIGKGQRGMIVSPPKAGKTTILKQIAHAIEANNPEVHLIVLLVEERPEEVTDMRRSVKTGEVVASTFDRPSDEHTAISELTIERAKRLVELGKDVVIVLDGITRLSRAYNLAQPATGRIMSGGVDSGALYPPRKFFGAARNIEEGGSLTILATALVETGSKMDEVIFEEFKGTGNMELRLDRRLAERRLYPAIDVNASSTRHEELLFERGQLQQVWKLRRVLNALAADGSAAPGLELLIDKIRSTKSNDEFLAEIAKGPAV